LYRIRNRRNKNKITACICIITMLIACSTYKIYSSASSTKVTVPSFVRCKAPVYTYVYKEANKSSKKLGKSYAGYVHRLLGVSGNFYKINYFIKKQNVVGFVEKNYYLALTPRLGIDVSKWQKKIDWKKVGKARVSGKKVEFVIQRLGYSNSVGKCFVDSTFETNLKGAHSQGMDIGVYFYSKAKSVKDAQKEAKFVIDKLSPHKNKITMPVVIDYEDSDVIKGLSKTQVTNICSAFVNKVKAAGYKARIYSCENIIKNKMNFRNLPCRTWVAKYPKNDNGKNLSYPHINNGNIWQFSSNGHIDGIPTRVDMNWDMSP